jgi:hypothetical protein
VQVRIPLQLVASADGLITLHSHCSNCFKKRREHTVPPEIAIEADKAASQAAHAQAASAAAAAIKTEQLRAAAAVTEGKMLAEKIAANCASAEAVAAATAASKLQAAAAAEHLAIAAACTQVRRDSEVQALNEKQLEVMLCVAASYACFKV